MNWRLQVIIRKATAKLSYYKVLLLFGAAEPWKTFKHAEDCDFCPISLSLKPF